MNFGRAISNEIVRAKTLTRYRHLPNLSVCDLRRSPTSASLLLLFRGNDVKAFKTAAKEDDAGTKTASDGAFPTEYYANGWPEGGLAICAAFRSLLLRKVESN